MLRQLGPHQQGTKYHPLVSLPKGRGFAWVNGVKSPNHFAFSHQKSLKVVFVKIEINVKKTIQEKSPIIPSLSLSLFAFSFFLYSPSYMPMQPRILVATKKWKQRKQTTKKQKHRTTLFFHYLAFFLSFSLHSINSLFRQKQGDVDCGQDKNKKSLTFSLPTNLSPNQLQHTVTKLPTLFLYHFSIVFNVQVVQQLVPNWLRTLFGSCI